ncbi:hypothetical protein POM88_047987 [Heracleum sosnowskyi]|uniref:Uncharacterized protein n=1 Tax=Heracleum sosnowskyi TaxID=360622 RepID=A0AAD8GVE1_9APIA|nr:hypothetical protein POM88_047987 [Heracleum sosnowskyi]
MPHSHVRLKSPEPLKSKSDFTIYVRRMPHNFSWIFVNALEVLRLKDSHRELGIASTFTKKLQSWFQLPDGKWELARIMSSSGREWVISLSEEKTKAGPVLVAVNPFKKVPLYGNDYIEAYRCKSSDLPHVYAITDNT